MIILIPELLNFININCIGYSLISRVVFVLFLAVRGNTMRKQVWLGHINTEKRFSIQYYSSFQTKMFLRSWYWSNNNKAWRKLYNILKTEIHRIIYYNTNKCSLRIYTIFALDLLSKWNPKTINTKMVQKLTLIIQYDVLSLNCGVVRFSWQ